MVAMNVYPLKFKAIYKERIWGGQELRNVFDKNIPQTKKIGESWEITDLPNDKSIIANGPMAGHPLNSIIERYPKEIMGDANFKGSFPLLIKFLDAEDTLSVQVHPDKKTCERMGKGSPKTECWYIIAAKPDAVIYKGFKKNVTKEQFAEAIEKGTVDELLAKIPVKGGQCHFLPAGTVHAIGAGLLIAEIQTPSDTTYRVFDWNRIDEKGNGRKLHIYEALESINFEKTDNTTTTTAGRLVDCEYFKIDKKSRTKNEKVPILKKKLRILIFMTGSGQIISDNDSNVGFKAGECVLIPALCEIKVQFDNDMEYLDITI